MIRQIVGDFALALGHLSDPEFFWALGMALFGGASMTLVRLLRTSIRTVERPADRLGRDEAA